MRRLAAGAAWLDARVFHCLLAACLALWACIACLREQDAQVRGVRYDTMVRHRLLPPQADPDIVILDIDERSLARMAGEFGRWPWPRDVLAAVLSDLEAQGVQAVVFDILFADPDHLNAAGDRALADAVAVSRRSYFSVLRLSPHNDPASQVRARQLPGLVTLGPDPRAGAQPLALVPPFFASAVASGRLGTNNVQPDADGVIRRYRLWEEVGGVRIASLPQRLGQQFGWPAQPHGDPLLQWMAQPLAYRTVSFADYFEDTQRSAHRRPRDEFKGKIVVVGATATSLYDIKATPLGALHPGVDVLATAIDNAKNGRFLHELDRWQRLVLSLALIGAMAWLSLRYAHERMEAAFLVAPALLLLTSYASLSTGWLFIDLDAPASLSLIYFSVTKLYNQQVRRHWCALPPAVAAQSHIVCLTLSWQGAAQAGVERRFYEALRRHAPDARALLREGSAEPLLPAVFEHLSVALWLVDGDGLAAARQQRAALAAALQERDVFRSSLAEAPASAGVALLPQLRKVIFSSLVEETDL